LAIYGEEDDNLYKSVAAFVVDDTPDRYLVGVPAAGHLCNLERPDIFASELLRFLSSTSGTDTENSDRL
jgi:pimeloyl-ACP methyl ester carboxylesterase